MQNPDKNEVPDAQPDDPTAGVHNWPEIAALAARQHGVISRQQLVVSGLSRGAIASWVKRGLINPVAPRVFAVAGAPTTWRTRLMSGLLSLGAGAAVSHRAAAQLHGLDRATGDHVEFLVERSRRSPRIDAVVHSSKRIRPIDVITVDGLRVTSATRTILDLANIELGLDGLRAAIDSAVRLQLSSPEVIRRRMGDLRGPGRAGVRTIDGLLDDAGGHSMLERRFLQLLRQAGLPRPECQRVYRDGDRTVARVDFVYPEWRIVVEVSGRLGHSTPDDRARDAQRRNELQDLGLRVYEFTWNDVTKRSSRVVEQMRRRLLAAGWSP
jgi:very-short-patch-repair endonuclease